MTSDLFDPWPGDGADEAPERGRQDEAAGARESDITLIADDPSLRQRQLVHLDGRQTISMLRKVVEALGLRAGQRWNRPELARKCREQEYKLAQETAVALLAKRSRSIADLGRRLRRKGYSPSAASAVIQRLAELRLVSDEQFAEDLLESLQRRESLGRRAILDRMRREGLPRDLAERVIEERVEDEGEATRAFVLARKRLSRMSGVEPGKARRRVYGYLIRRGFAVRHAADAVREAVSELEAAGGPVSDETADWDASEW